LDLALQDVNNSAAEGRGDENYDQYYLRIKKCSTTKASGANGSDHTADTSANYFKSKRLQAKNAEADNENPNNRSALIPSLLMESKEMQSINQHQSKISNQNALLSLLSQDDFSNMKNQIQNKIQFNPM
jgi:hypothetical protein|tara:strand:+ start:1058 stop:1444 length:387 start_codon:yes stop_codon:yes gene_type:complete